MKTSVKQIDVQTAIANHDLFAAVAFVQQSIRQAA
jgi:hypothetical protein